MEPFETNHSSIIRSNDGRLTINRETNPKGYTVTDSTDAHVELFTTSVATAEAFVAGYDYAQRQLAKDEQLALYLTPLAIRGAFDGYDDEREAWVDQASEDELREVGDEVLSSDALYGAYRESLEIAIDDRRNAS